MVVLVVMDVFNCGISNGEIMYFWYNNGIICINDGVSSNFDGGIGDIGNN